MKKERELEDIDEEKAEDGEAATELHDDAIDPEQASGKTDTGGLEQVLAARDSEIAGLKHSLDELRGKSDGLGEELARAVAAYRELAIRANPGVPVELIAGNTIDEVNESLKKARVLIDRVRQEIERETSHARVPAGAPQRSVPDISTLSPREKIQLSLERAPS